MSQVADQLVEAATAHVQRADRQGDPLAEFHLRHAEVLAQVAQARYLRTISDALETIVAAIDRGAQTAAGRPATTAEPAAPRR